MVFQSLFGSSFNVWQDNTISVLMGKKKKGIYMACSNDEIIDLLSGKIKVKS